MEEEKITWIEELPQDTLREITSYCNVISKDNYIDFLEGEIIDKIMFVEYGASIFGGFTYKFDYYNITRGEHELHNTFVMFDSTYREQNLKISCTMIHKEGKRESFDDDVEHIMEKIKEAKHELYFDIMTTDNLQFIKNYLL